MKKNHIQVLLNHSFLSDPTDDIDDAEMTKKNQAFFVSF